MKIIFHGDDFGLTAGVNKGIIRSFKDGLISSTSLVSSGMAAKEAICLARENPDIDVGIHLTLCDESPVLPPRQLASIIPKGASFPSREKVLQLICTRKISYSQVEREWSAQIEKGFNAGIPLSHLDGHQFIHLFPGLWHLCLRLAVKYKIPYVKTTILDPVSLKVSLKRSLQLMFLKLWIRYFISPRVFSSIRSIPSIGFLHAGGRMECHNLLGMIDWLRHKQSCSIVEVMLHPGVDDMHTANKYKHWQYKWEKDLDLLLDPSLAKALDRRGIEITSYRELAERRVYPGIS